MRRIFPVLLFVLPMWGQNSSVDELLADGSVHDIYLEMNAGDWASLKRDYLLDTRYPADFIFNGTTISKVSVRSRGSGSRNPIKPSLKIDYDGYVDDQVFGGLKSLVLDNNVEDLSMVKERTVMKAMRIMGAPAPRESSARLIVNGEFAGIYTVVEPIDKVFAYSRFGENQGTLYEYNPVQPFYFNDLGPDPAAYVPALFEPKGKAESAKAERLVNFIERLNSIPDQDFLNELEKLLDVDRFLLLVAVQQYLAEVDGVNGWNGTNNFYLYQSPDDSPRFTFIAWDDDLSFFNPELSVRNNFDQVVLTKRIWNDPELKERYLTALRRVSDFCGGPNGWLVDELNFALRQVSPYVDGDPTNVCSDGEGNTVSCEASRSPFDVASEVLRQFGAQRFAYVTDELKQF